MAALNTNSLLWSKPCGYSLKDSNNYDLRLALSLLLWYGGTMII